MDADGSLLELSLYKASEMSLLLLLCVLQLLHVSNSTRYHTLTKRINVTGVLRRQV